MNAQEHDTKQFLQPTVNAISTMLELPAAIWLVDETANVLRATAVTELLEEKIGNAEIPLDSPNVGADVFRTCQTAVINNIETEKGWRFKAEILSLGLKSAIVAPLPIKTRIVGLLVIYVPENKPSNLEELKPKVEISADQIAASLRHIRGLETLNEVGQLINSEIQQAPDIFRHILEYAQKVLDCKHVSIFLTDSVSGNLLLKDSSSPDVKRKYFKPGQGIVSEVVKSGKTLLVSDVRKHPKFVKGLTTDVEERSMLLSPIKFENQIIGVISADFHELNGFDNHDQILLEALTKHTTTALQNSDLYQKERDKARVLTDLHEISNDLLSIEKSPETRKLLEKIAEKSKQVLKADLLEFYEYKQEQNEFILPHIIIGERKDKSVPKDKIFSDDSIFSLIHQSEPLYIEDAQNKDDLTKPYTFLRKDQPEKRYVIREDIKSTAVIPLRTGDESMGLMFANYRTNQEFTKEQKELIGLFADQAAIAIKNARLYYYVNQRREVLVDVAKNITTKINLFEDDVIKLIYEQANNSLGMKNLSIALYDETTDTVRFALVSLDGKLVDVINKPGWEPRQGGKGKTEKVIRNKGYFLISSLDELKKSEFTPKPGHIKYVDRNAYSWLGVPMIIGSKILGVIANYNYDHGNLYTEDDIEILQALADIAAIGIENARLYEEIRKSRDELDLRVQERNAELVTERNLLRTLIDNMPDHIYVKDTESRFILANKTVMYFAGAETLNELKGKTDFDFHPEMAEQYFAYEQEVIKLGRKMINREERIIDQNTGSTKWLLSTKVPFKDTEGKIAGLVGINRDITLSKQVEEIVAKINTALNFEESLESIVIGAVELVPVRTAGVIHLFDIDRQNITKSYAFPEDFVHAPRFPEKTALTWQIFETGELIEISDISESSRVSETMRQSDVKSIIGVPLKVSNKVIGVLYLKALEKHKLTQDEKTVLTMLCEHASLVIEKARRYDHLDLLRQVSGKISATLEINEIMPLILRGAIRLTGAAFGDIHLIDQKSVSVYHSFEYPEDFRHPVPRLSEKKGLTWTIMETGNPVIIPDITEDPRVNNVLIKKGIRSLIGVPLKLQDSVTGVLYLNYPQVHHYTDEEKSLLFTLSDQAAISIRNATQFEKSEKRQKTLDLLQGIVARINTSSDFGELLEHIVQGAVELVPIETAGVIHLFDIAGQDISKSHAFPKSFVHTPRFSEKKGQTWKIFNTGEIDEITDASQSSSGVSEEMRERKVKSIIGVPLKLKGKVIGVLYLKALEQHKFTHDEKTVLTMLCEHASIVIEKARRYEHLDLLRKVSGKISATLELNEIMPLILRGAIRLTGAAFGDIHLIDQKSVSVYHSFEYPEGFRHPVPRLSENKGLTWTIMETGNPVIIPDITEDSRVNDVLIKKGIRSLIGVPLKLQDNVTGVLYLNYPQPHLYTEEEKSLLFTLSDQAAISIENARLFDNLEKLIKERTERLENLNHRQKVLIDLGQKLTSTIQLNEDQILQLIYRNATELMDTKNMYIALYDESSDTVRFGLVYKEDGKINTKEGEEEEGYKPRSGGQGKTEYIIKAKKPIFHPTLAESEAWYEEPGHLAYDRSILPSWVGVPMITGEKVLGVIATYNPIQEHVYRKDDLEILQVMANLAAIALDNARMYSDLEENKKMLENALNTIAETQDIITRSILASDIVHRLNNLAGTIPICVNQLKEELENGINEVKTDISNLDRMVRNLDEGLNEIEIDVNNLLQTVEEVKQPPEKTEIIDIISIVRVILDWVNVLYNKRIESGNIQIVKEINSESHKVIGFASPLSHAIFNIISNSIESLLETSGGGLLTIKVNNIDKINSEWVKIEIIDTGIGIPKENLNKIFTPSFTTKGHGRGFGLWRAKNVIENMSGEICVNSESESITRFTILLPKAQKEN